MLPSQEIWVRSSVGKLRSHKPHSKAKNKQNLKKEIVRERRFSRTDSQVGISQMRGKEAEGKRKHRPEAWETERLCGGKYGGRVGWQGGVAISSGL